MEKFELSFDFLFCCLFACFAFIPMHISILWKCSHFPNKFEQCTDPVFCMLCLYAMGLSCSRKQLISVHLNMLEHSNRWLGMVKSRFLQVNRQYHVAICIYLIHTHARINAFLEQLFAAHSQSIRIIHDTVIHLFFVSLHFNYNFQFSIFSVWHKAWNKWYVAQISDFQRSIVIEIKISATNSGHFRIPTKYWA